MNQPQPIASKTLGPLGVVLERFPGQTGARARCTRCGGVIYEDCTAFSNHHVSRLTDGRMRFTRHDWDDLLVHECGVSVDMSAAFG